MEEPQVVQVRGAGFGSGYLIAPRLVLTAAHNLPAGAAGITVSLWGSAGRSPAQVRWRDDTLDAALLEVPADDQDWVPPATVRRHPQRWGRFVTSGTEIRVTGMGFPRQQREDRERHAENVFGRVRPHRGTTFEILDAHGTMTFDAVDATTTAWSGISGTAVFGEGEKLLLGMVYADRRPEHGTRLRCVSSEGLLARDDFRAVVRAATGVDPQLEPAELTGLLEPAPPERALTSPSMMLRADAEVVPFHGREDTLAKLAQWCADDLPGPAAAVLTGPGGQGKTRLARELMVRLRRLGWVAGEIRGRPERAFLERELRPVQYPLLLVVDYAETRPELVRDLRSATERAAHPVRLLLLARSGGRWQDTTGGAVDETRLHALSPDPAGREHAFRAAARGLAQRMAEVTDRPDVDWPALAETVPAARPGADPGAETALTVQMSALVALLRHGQDAEPDAPVEKQLLFHERRYWLESAAGKEIGKRAATLLGPAVAAAVLCPARHKKEARETVARVLPHEQDWVVTEIAGLLPDLYPPSDGSHWGRLEPDRLAEYHAGEEILGDTELLGRLFDRAPDHQRTQILTTLARAAVAHANEGRPDTAREVVDQLRATLRGVPADRPLTAAVLRAHSDTLPEQSHVLRDYALDLARALSELCANAGDDPRARIDRAWALHNLAERYLAVGDRTNGRTAAEEAAAIRAELADATEPADDVVTRQAERAESLLVLSRAHRLTGQLTLAHATGAAALDLFRTLARPGGAEREKRERGLVRALLNQSRVVWQLDPNAIDFDQIAQSDAYTEEAVGLARELADRDPDLDPLLLTAALTERSNNLWRLKRHPESLPQSEEAVATARRLAEENPDAYAADLAHALLGLTVDYGFAPGPRDDEIALMLEAIGLLRPLAADLPGVHRPDLAQLLRNLACSQREDQDYPAARNSIDEAIELRRAEARGSYGLAVPRLAQSLSILGTIHARTGDHREAARTYLEALETFGHAPLPLTAEEQRSQSDTAYDLADSYEALGRAADALAAQNDAIAILSRLSEYAPNLYTQNYASALFDQSNLYWRQQRPVAARIRLRQALPRYRRLARVTENGTQWLAYCLYNLGTSYGESLTTAERAVAPLREAYELQAGLAAGDARHEPDLAYTCSQLARALARTGRFAESARIAAHGVRLQRRLLVADPDGREVALCHVLLRLAEGRAMAGHRAAAWRTAREAEETCLALADRAEKPPAEIAQILSRLARAISLCGRHDLRLAARAEAPARRAVRLSRELTDRFPGDSGCQNELRRAVTTLARVLEQLGRHTDAVDVQRRRGA
ncbi:MAG TPA: trypsin-like peptidase domain-containing protein [Actinophytocola sp.]|jgi:hypothetical protein|nr:trypsin-like peptidase domain-containing protein [Actinophytocola sp.]